MEAIRRYDISGLPSPARLLIRQNVVFVSRGNCGKFRNEVGAENLARFGRQALQRLVLYAMFLFSNYSYLICFLILERGSVDPAQDDIKKRVLTFEEGLKAAGIRLTPQRLEIIRVLAESNDHPDAETIHRTLRARMPTLSPDTVYRTLWLLLDLGLITTLGPSRGKARFDGNLAPHHHFVCTKCGLARDFTYPDYDRLSIPDVVKTFGSVERMEVEIRGVCADCARRGGPISRA